MSDNEPMFRILNDPIIKEVPWAFLAPHEKQAVQNHSQTLSRLNSRGGLSIHEAYYIAKDMPWPRNFPKRSKHGDAGFRLALMRLLYEFEVLRYQPPKNKQST